MSAVAEVSVQPAPRKAGEGHFDWWLLGGAAGLLALGLLAMLSASSAVADADYGNPLHFVTRQLVGVGMGVVAGTIVCFMPWRVLKSVVPLGYWGTIVLLVLVFTPLGHGAKGAHRWVDVGMINMQPSEYAKVALILMLARFLHNNEGRLGDFMGVVLPAFGIAAPVLGLVLFEPDFGSTVLLAGITMLMLFLAGMSLRWFGFLGLLGVPLMAGIALLEPYRVRRLVSFLDPFVDPEGSGYQVIQAWIALATGGLWGNGLGTGVAQRGFLPEAHTDFISAVLGEELGAIGWIGMIGLFVLVIWRGAHIATRAPDLFGNLAAMGATTLLGWQAIINLGVVVGWLPAKGLVLPFMSYGASAIVVHVLCIGLLLRIGMEGQVVQDAPATAGAKR